MSPVTAGCHFPSVGSADADRLTGSALGRGMEHIRKCVFPLHQGRRHLLWSGYKGTADSPEDSVAAVGSRRPVGQQRGGHFREATLNSSSRKP